MSVQLPSPSTAGSRRTITPRLAILATAIASTIVIETGNPSGIVETTSAVAKAIISRSP